MVFLKQIGLEWLAPDIGGRGRHVHHVAGSPNREHTPERNRLRRRAKRDFPSVGFDDLHDDRRNQQDEKRDRSELRRRVVDLPRTDMPNNENEGEETDNE